MGFIQSNGPRRSDANALSLGWESLGRVIQSRTLDSVARHFFDVGLAELCLDALIHKQVEKPIKTHQGIEHE